MVRPGQIGIYVAEAGDPIEHPVAFELEAELRAFVLRRHDHHLARGEVLAILAFLALEREHIVTGRDQANRRRTCGRPRSNYDYVSVQAHPPDARVARIWSPRGVGTIRDRPCRRATNRGQRPNCNGIRASRPPATSASSAIAATG